MLSQTVYTIVPARINLNFNDMQNKLREKINRNRWSKAECVGENMKLSEGGNYYGNNAYPS